jgi:type IV pilus assembly protein PilA
MLQNKRKGFTLIELLIVVVIIGILAAIAIPKFAATKDKAKLASVKTDVRNLMSLMEGNASDNGSYSAPAAGSYAMSQGNVATFSAVTAAGYTISVTNASITSGQDTCEVSVGAAQANPALDGVIACS